MPRVKIRRVHLRGFQQFGDTELDFTDATDATSDRICLIGPNGTGKSTILRLLDRFLSGQNCWPDKTGRLRITLDKGDQRVAFVSIPELGIASGWFDVTSVADEGRPLLECTSGDEFHRMARDRYRPMSVPMISQFLPLQAGSDLVVYSPAEMDSEGQGAPSSRVNGVPQTNLDQALGLFRAFHLRHLVSDRNTAEMWRVLVYLVKKRENDRQEFETRPESLSKTKSALIEHFEQTNPPVLDNLAELWNRILKPLGLYFDSEGARLPVQLADNLVAHIRACSTKTQIEYARLSTGVRAFLFRVGHLYLLYFGRSVRSGFVLIDEPENSLFPDFLFELMETYERILTPQSGKTSTQLFMATHNPIVAAQFEPHERIVLEWDDSGHVVAHHGVSPKGDDPNDLLLRDFHLPQVLGPAGRARWRQYQQLRKDLRSSTGERKQELAAQAAEIARQYRFTPDQS